MTPCGSSKADDVIRKTRKLNNFKILIYDVTDGRTPFTSTHHGIAPVVSQVILQRFRLVSPGYSRVCRVVRPNLKIADVAAFLPPDGVNQVSDLRQLEELSVQISLPFKPQLMRGRSRVCSDEFVGSNLFLKLSSQRKVIPFESVTVRLTDSHDAIVGSSPMTKSFQLQSSSRSASSKYFDSVQKAAEVRVICEREFYF